MHPTNVPALAGRAANVAALANVAAPATRSLPPRLAACGSASSPQWRRRSGAMVPDHGRQSPRFPVKLEVTLLGRTEVKAVAENVSVGGLFLKMDAPTGKMQLIRMKLVLPTDGQELVAHGVGRHVIDRASGSPVAGVGVAFFGFGGPQLKRWEAYIQQVSLAHASSRLLQHATPPAFVPQPAAPHPFLPQRTPPPAVPDRAAVVAAAPKVRLPLPPPARMQAALTTQAVRAPARCELRETILDEGDLEYV